MVCQTSRTNDNNSRTNGRAVAPSCADSGSRQKTSARASSCPGLGYHKQAFKPIFFFNQPTNRCGNNAPGINCFSLNQCVSNSAFTNPDTNNTPMGAPT